MSFYVTAWVKGLTGTGGPSAKATLLTMADYANEFGEVTASQAAIARETEQSVDSVQRRLADLQSKGLVARFRRTRANGSRTTDLVVMLWDDRAKERAEYYASGADPLVRQSERQTQDVVGGTADCGMGDAADCGGGYRTGAVGDTALLRHPEPSLYPSIEQGRECGGAQARHPRDISSLDGLEATLRKAGGEALDPTSPALCQLSPILNCLDSGCDVDLDVIPTIREIAARRIAKPSGLGRRIGSWEFFTARIFEAKSRRMAPPPPETAHDTDPRHHRPGRPPGTAPRNGVSDTLIAAVADLVSDSNRYGLSPGAQRGTGSYR